MAYRGRRRGGYRGKRNYRGNGRYRGKRNSRSNAMFQFIDEANRLFGRLMKTQDMIERRWRNRKRSDRASLESARQSPESPERNGRVGRAGRWFFRDGKQMRYVYTSDGSRLGVQYKDGGRYGL